MIAASPDFGIACRRCLRRLGAGPVDGLHFGKERSMGLVSRFGSELRGRDGLVVMTEGVRATGLRICSS